MKRRSHRGDKNRSTPSEKASSPRLANVEAANREKRDLEIINRNAGRLNDEALDVLEYQKSL